MVTTLNSRAQETATLESPVVSTSGASAASNAVTPQAAATPTPTPTLISLGVTPSSASIDVDETLQFEATGSFSDGSSQNLTATVWSSSNTGVAKVSRTGLATGIGDGTATITASFDGKTGSATLQVSAVIIGEIEPTVPEVTEEEVEFFSAIADLVGGSESQQEIANDIISGLAASLDEEQRQAATDIIGTLAASQEAPQRQAATDIIGSLAASLQETERQAATGIIGSLAASLEETQQQAATEIIESLAVSLEEDQRQAATDIVGSLATSPVESQQDAATSIVAALVVSLETSQQDAATSIILSLAAAQQAAATNIISSLIGGTEQEQDAAATIGERAAADVEGVTAITAVFNDVTEDPDALARLGLPHEVITRETAPTPGVQGWQATGSPAPIEQILTRFATEISGAHVEIEDVAELPAGVPALPEGLVVNAVLRLTAENFQSEDAVANHVTFFVAKSWLEANGIHPWSVQFNRFDEEDGVWVPNLGKLVREDQERIFYTSVIPGFSLWAITGTTEPPSARFRAENLSVSPTAADAGQDIQVTAQLTNLSSQSAEYTAVMWVDGQAFASVAVTIGATATETVTFTVQASPGVHTIRIDRLLGGVRVEVPTPPTELPVTGGATAPNWLLLAIALAGTFFVLAGWRMIGQRRW